MAEKRFRLITGQTGLSMLWCCMVGTANHVPDLLSQIAEVLLQLHESKIAKFFISFFIS